LTGLYNHRFFHDRLRAELNRARRYGDELSVIVVDVDNFGEYNAAYGHLAGDMLLASMGSKLVSACGSPLICARLGGDEFGVIVPESDAIRARLIAQRVIDVVGIECGDTPGTLSASAGVATYPEHASDATELVRLADGALFHAKETGKARVVPYEPHRVPDLSAKERIDRLERQSRLSAVRALAAAVDARDTATRFHSQQVSALAKEVAQTLNMSESHVRLVELAALLHDVGKIGVSDSVLNKPSPLTENEWREIRQHSQRGEEILRSTDLVEILSWVRGHHERWDGAGYPDGLRGAAIPLEARILSVCDAYDAMTSDRAYRRSMSQQAAFDELASSSGSQFDPVVVQALIDSVGTRPLAGKTVASQGVAIG
jgi:diguanylate cyclase (GGDEF)-like protein/putative nucleotidyltransferase with HDIG domain